MSAAKPRIPIPISSPLRMPGRRTARRVGLHGNFGEAPGAANANAAARRPPMALWELIVRRRGGSHTARSHSFGRRVAWRLVCIGDLRFHPCDVSIEQSHYAARVDQTSPELACSI